MIDHGKLVARDGGFAVAAAGAVTDQTLLAIATDFENAVMRKIIALAAEDLPQRFPGDEPVLVTQKYDGEGVFVYWQQGDAPFCFNAPSGRVRIGLPALADLQKRLEAAGVRKALLRAELCLPQDAGSVRAGVSEVIRISFSGTAGELARLKLVLLDAVMIDGKDLRAQQHDFACTLELLQRIGGADDAQRVHCMRARSVPESEVAAAFDDCVRAGGEGLVVRRLQRAEAYKIKPLRHVDALVIGYVEGESDGQLGVASLLTALTYTDAAEGKTWLQGFARVGSGLKDEERAQLLDTLRPLQVDAPLTMTDSSGRAIHFVKPRWIAEIAGEDLSFGNALEAQRMQLFAWDEARQAYEFAGLTPCPRLTFARFKRMREDKDWKSGGARFTQIGADGQHPQPRADGSAGARVVRKEIYLKGEMLRKLVVAQRGGEEGFPYVVFWTDFSARRAEPLKVTTQYAMTPTRAQQIAQRLLEEGVTRGFVRVDADAPAPVASEAVAAEPAPASATPAKKPPKAVKPKKSESKPKVA